MTRKTIRFSKCFLPCAIASVAIAVFGVAGLLSRGINFGLDFRPGLIEEVRAAPAVMSVSYSGQATAVLELGADGAQVVISGIGAENETKAFPFSEFPTVDSLAEAFNQIEGVSAVVSSYGDSASSDLFVSSSSSNKLGSAPYALYSAGKIEADVEAARAALSSIESAAVQRLGSGSGASLQIRVADKGDGRANSDIQEEVSRALGAAFGEGNVVVIKTDFIGSSFSASISWRSMLLLAATIALIWLYSAIRFHWDFALGAIVAILHDALIMMTFIVWTKMEFTTMTVAAILTIVGYSINDTIVILDRERSLLPVMKIKKFSEVVDQALTDSLSRSIITTVTTMFAALALYAFTSGDIKNFALALIVGLVSGCYSSLFISSGVIVSTRRKWRPEFGIHHSLRNRSGMMDMGVSV